MHQKYKNKLNRRLHSIPISKFRLENNKQLRCFSYSIPLVCVLALLSILNCAISITELDRSYALEGDIETSEAIEVAEDAADEEIPDTVEDIVALDTTADIPTAIDADGGISMTIAGNLSQQTQAEPGKLAYRSHNVKISGTNIEQYSLRISYDQGSSALAYDGSGGTTIAGAGGKTGTSSDGNWWGYSWHNNGAGETTLTYQTMPAYGSGTTLESASPSDNNVTIDKTLTFAAKFADNATPGHYKTNVLLSLTSTPKQVSAGMETKTYMQDVDGDVCKATPDGWSGSLIDNRGTSPITYTVRKHEDGNCWMTQNLRLPGGTQITSANSDVSSDYTLPNSSKSGFSSDTVAYMYNGTSNSSNYALDYGAYYSWCAATANTCSGVTAGNDASSSICPKGWKLPPNSGKGSYAELASAIEAGNDTAGSTKFRNSTYKFNYAGYYLYSSLDGDGANGYCWSRTANSDTRAHYLYLDSNRANPSSYYDRRRGFSVRCVALSS